MNYKRSIRIILVLIVLIAAGHYLWAKTAYLDFAKPKLLNLVGNKDETAGWKTYTNDKYGFEFKYPASLGDVIDNTRNDSEIVNNGSDENCKVEGNMLTARFSGNEFTRFGGVSKGYNECLGRGAGTFDIETFDISDNEIRLHTWYGLDFNKGDILDKVKTASGKDAYIFKYLSFGEVTAIAIHGVDDRLSSLFFEFSYKDKDIFKKILSTFKFTK